MLSPFILDELNKYKAKATLFYLGSKPDPDFLIRTGGYKRLSNYLIYSSIYETSKRFNFK